ncbi:MAG: hypothetical protein DRP38_02280 [Thermotogae bacterium]|nr:MAG: hypothetical protein DRP38_02280 [Thermotogota bacterium]
MKRSIALIFMLLISIAIFSKTIHITSNLVKPKEKEIFYEGGVVVKIEEDNLKLSTDNMVVRKVKGSWREMEATGTVVVELEYGVATSTYLQYDITDGVGKMAKDVGVAFVDEKSSDTVYISCDEMSFNLKEEKFEGTSEGTVVINKGSMEMYAKEFEYDRKEGVVTLKGDVFIKDPEKDFKMWAEEAKVFTEKDEAIALKVKMVIEVKD